MAMIRQHVAAERTPGVEAQLRAPRAQLTPGRNSEQGPASRGTALGCCRRCSAVVYASDNLAMVAGYLMHGDCAPATG